MREILFRGKRIDNGKWVEGYYAAEPYTKNTYNYGYILENEKDLFAKKAWLVDSRTVGQFTGLTANGKRIFEGDIVVVPLSGKPAKGIVEYFKTDICGFAVITQPQYSNYVLHKNYAYEVIGNIYDNPELLEVTE